MAGRGLATGMALVEFKYPREPSVKNAAWAMIYAEVLKDFYRLAAYPRGADRLFVYAESARLATFMAGAARRYGLDIAPDDVELQPVEMTGMPKTVLDVLAADSDPVGHGPQAGCASRCSEPVAACLPRGGSRRPAATGPISSMPAGQPNIAPPIPAVSPGVLPTGTGVRLEILAAIDAIAGRSGGDVFELNDVVVEMPPRRHWLGRVHDPHHGQWAPVPQCADERGDALRRPRTCRPGQLPADSLTASAF
jgi:hypothetical protein